MNCLMLQNCLEELRGNSDEPDDINVQISCACCGGIVKEATIETNDEANKENEENEAINNDVSTQHRRSDETEGNILQSKASGRSKLSQCFGKCCKCFAKKNETMVNETKYVYTTSAGTQDVSES